MCKYDYVKAVTCAVLDWIKNNSEYIEENVNVEDITEENRRELQDFLHDELFACDSVTGNGSGSFDVLNKQCNVLENMDLVCDAFDEFGYKLSDLARRIREEDWDYLDVTVRCSVLDIAISRAIDECERMRGN